MKLQKWSKTQFVSESDLNEIQHLLCFLLQDKRQYYLRLQLKFQKEL